jgi:RND superfamily putative drug exporter
VLAIWLIIFVLTIAIGRAVGTNYSNNFNLPGTESTKALHLLQAVEPKSSGDNESVVFATSGGAKITDPSIEAAINKTLSKIAGVQDVGQVISPFSVAGATQISKDGTIAFAQVKFSVLGQNISTKLAKHFVAVAQSGATKNLQVAISGQVAENANRASVGGTAFGILFAGVILFLVFGSIFATLLPLLSAIVALGTATSIIGLLTHVMKMPMFSPELVALIGLGVGVDYALFITSRHRQGLLEGKTNEASIVQSVNTSGRAVLFAGIIVCIALLGMFALGVSFLYGLAVAASIGVAFTMIAALTLLPAMLGFIGPRIMSKKQRRTLATTGPRAAGESSGGFWTKWAGFVDRRPSIPAVLAIGLVVLIAIPFFSMRLGSSDQGNDPVGTTTRTAYDLLAKGFGPGYNGPLEVVAVVKNAQQTTAVTALEAKIKTTPDVASVVPFVVPGKDLAAIFVYPKSAPQDGATTALIANLRTSIIPPIIKGTGLTVYVGGVTAIFVDFAHVLSSKLPLFIGLVVLLSFLLLAVVFRSIVVPLVSAAMNLLSIGAAFGVLTAVFQWGWLGGLFGVSRAGPVESFLPVMMFAILFGLSMDYQVFLVTRMHEEWIRTGDNREAVRRGLAGTGKTITAAAAIMIAVFGSFILGGERIIKEFGLGLAGGVFVDAVIIRMAIVPAVMNLLGKANWWFPEKLDKWLPRIGLEHEEPSENSAL